jgi:4-oxalocrotonate tautomerase
MPHIDISMFTGRDDETKKRVADAVVETMMKELGCQRSHLSVAIHDVDPKNWNEEVHDKVDASKVYSGEVYKAE